jgi:hypothetical protein
MTPDMAIGGAVVAGVVVILGLTTRLVKTVLSRVPSSSPESAVLPAAFDPARCAVHTDRIDRLQENDAEQRARLTALETQAASNQALLAGIDKRTDDMYQVLILKREPKREGRP